MKESIWVSAGKRIKYVMPGHNSCKGNETRRWAKHTKEMIKSN